MAGSRLVVGVVVVASLSGCLSLSLGGESRSLTLPDLMVGEYARTLARTEGHEVVRGLPQKVQESRTVERTVTLEQGKDAFLRPVPVVEVRTQLQIDVGRDSARRTEYLRFDQATRELVERGRDHGPSAFTGFCQSLLCSSTPGSESRTARVFPRDESGAGPPLLAGRTLVVGKPLRLEIAATSHWTEYFPLRFEDVRGERTLLVEVRHGSDEAAEPRDLTGPLTQYWHRMWFSERSNVPVREEHTTAVLTFQRWYWLNRTATLEEFRPGTANAFSPGPGRPPLDRMPGVTTVQASGLLQSFPARMAWDPWTAWRYALADPTARDLHAFMSTRPGAIPYDGTYYHEKADQTHTWLFRVGQPGDEASMAVEVRLHERTGLRETYLPAEWRGGIPYDPPPESFLAVPLVRIEDVFRVHAEGRLDRFDAFAFGFGGVAGPTNEPRPFFAFIEPRRVSETAGGRLGHAWFAWAASTIDLKDGGRSSENWTNHMGHHHSPFLLGLPDCEAGSCAASAYLGVGSKVGGAGKA